MTIDLRALAQRYRGVPSSWKIVPLGDVLEDIVGGGTPSRNEPSYWNGDIPWLTVKDMRTRRPAAAQEHISARAVKESATSIIPPDTVITATRVGLGKVVRVPFAAAINQDLKALIVRSEVEKAYLEYWILSIAPFLEAVGSGTTVKGIRLETLRRLPFPLAPIREQRKIVAELEKQFSRLDEAVANLKRVKANLKRHKASVLDAAVKGRLGARGSASDNELPTGWRWSSIGELAQVGTGATPARSNEAFYRGGTIPWITSSAVNEPFVDVANQFVTVEALRQTNLTLYPPGTLLVAMYGEGKTRGKCSELRIAATTNQALAALQVEPAVRPWLKLFLDHNYDDTRRIASGGVQPNLNLGLIRAIRLPLPPGDEQHRMLAEVDRRLSVFREVEAEVEVSRKRAEALRQAVLKRTFVAQP